jgi:hypothetical protein
MTRAVGFTSSFILLNRENRGTGVHIGLISLIMQLLLTNEIVIMDMHMKYVIITGIARESFLG